MIPRSQRLGPLSLKDAQKLKNLRFNWLLRGKDFPSQ